MATVSGKDGQLDDWTSFEWASVAGVPIEQNGLGYFIAAAACTSLAVVSYYEFLRADYFIYGFDTSAWSTTSGYTVDQWIFLVLGTYMLPLAIIFMLLFASHSYKNIPHTHWIKPLLYITLFATFATFTGISYDIASDVLSCITYFCLGTDAISTDDASTTIKAGKVFVGMIYFFVSFFFTFIFAGLTAMLFIARRRIKADASLAGTTSETQPLLGASKKGVETTFTSRSSSTAPLSVRVRGANRKVNRKWYVLLASQLLTTY
jgi:hypothetical protein